MSPQGLATVVKPLPSPAFPSSFALVKRDLFLEQTHQQLCVSVKPTLFCCTHILVLTHISGVHGHLDSTDRIQDRAGGAHCQPGRYIGLTPPCITSPPCVARLFPHHRHAARARGGGQPQRHWGRLGAGLGERGGGVGDGACGAHRAGVMERTVPQTLATVICSVQHQPTWQVGL